MQSTILHKHDNSLSNSSTQSKVAVELTSAATEPSSGKIQAAHNLNRSSIFQLMRNLVDETKTLIRQELALGRKEVAEKLAYAGRNAVGLGAGAAIAYAGAIVLLIALGCLIAWAIRLAGVEGLFAAFLGLIGVGLITVSVGGMLILKGVSALKAESLAPQRTLQTLQEFKGRPTGPKPKPAPRMPEPSSAEMQSRVEATEDHIGETLAALRDRVSPKNINRRIQHRIQVHPYRSGLLAMGAGLASGFAIRRRFRRA